MTQDDLKRMAAEAALVHVEPSAVLGVGSGTTVHRFIDALAGIKNRVEAAVASSMETARRLEHHGFRLVDLNDVDEIPVYVDGADESNHDLQLIKGGGGALTREKIIAAASTRFVCIADGAKLVDRLGAFPLPVEVIPMSRGLVSREIERIGGRPVWREGFVTDNGNVILDVHDLAIDDPPALEAELNQIAGVVTNGLFARRPADLLLLGTPDGLRTLP